MKKIKIKNQLLVMEQLKQNLSGLSVKQLAEQTELPKTIIQYITRELKRHKFIKSRRPLQFDNRYVIYYIVGSDE